jgi:hypothetical protein
MNNKPIRPRLLEMEERTPELEKRFEEEMKKMLEKQIKPSGRIMWLLTSLVGAYFMIHFSYLAIVIKDVPWLVRFGFAGGAAFGCAWVALSIRVLNKGSFRMWRDENAIHGLVFGFSLLLLITLLLLGGQAKDRITGIQLMLSGCIFFIIFGIPSIFNTRINRTESSLREQLLRIELRMAELADKSKHEK